MDTQCQWLIQVVEEEEHPGFTLALLLILLRRDKQNRCKIRGVPKALRILGRDIVSFRNLLVALDNCLTPRQLERAELSELDQVTFDPEQTKEISSDLRLAAQRLEHLNPKLVDRQGRAKISDIQEVINRLIQRAIERSQQH